jgi:alanyl aminopeptidase
MPAPGQAVAQRPAEAAPAVSEAAEAPPVLQLPKDTHPLRYALSMRIDPRQQRFSGTAGIEVQLDRARSVIWLHGRGLHVTSSAVDGAAAAWEQVNPEGLARVTTSRPVGPGKVTLQIAWDREFEPQIVGLYLAHEAGESYAVTQFEAVDARRAFPGFDEPVFKTPFDVTLTVPSDDVAIANTMPTSEEAAEAGMKRVRFGTTKPLPTYLVAWAVGPFDVVVPPPLPPNEVRHRPLQVRGIAPKGRGDEFAFALKTGAEELLLLEKYFGTEFPFEKLDHIAVPDYTYGAMENAGAIVYREEILLFKPGVSSEQTKSGIAGVMAHEMAHQWFGDLVTMRWWTDTWLNESFATWMGNRTVQEWDPAYGAWTQFLGGVNRAKQQDSLASARAVRQPLDAIKNVWNQFDRITYLKGGSVLAMFERWLGTDRFRDGIRRYLAAHAYGGGDTDDLLDAISQEAGRDVKTPFHTFLDQAGVPLVEAKVSCLDGKGRLELEQSRYLPIGSEADRARLWKIPVCARYGEGGSDHESCTLLEEQRGSLPLEGCPDWLLPNADASGYYRWTLPFEDLRKLTGKAYSRLNARERIALADDVRAAIHSGKLSFADGMAVIAPMAADPDPQVASVPLEILTAARDDLIPEASRELVEEWGRKLYGPVAHRLGWTPRRGEPLPVRAFRSRVLFFLAFKAHEPRVIAEANRRGRAYAGLADGKFHPAAVDPGLAGLALSVAVRQGGAPVFNEMAKRFDKLQDATMRRRVLFALAATADPALRDRVLAMPLDPRLRKNERIDIFLAVAEHTDSREAAWEALKKEFDQLIPLVPESHAMRSIGLVTTFCDLSHLADARAFFAERAPRMPGGARAMTETLEEVKLCSAWREAQASSAQQFFAHAQTPPRR